MGYIRTADPVGQSESAEEMMSQGISIIRVQVNEGAKERLDSLCKRRGMTHIAVMSRLVNWFTTQDDIIQASVLNVMDEEALAPLASKLLKRIASATPSGKKGRKQD